MSDIPTGEPGLPLADDHLLAHGLIPGRLATHGQGLEDLAARVAELEAKVSALPIIGYRNIRADCPIGVRTFMATLTEIPTATVACTLFVRAVGVYGFGATAGVTTFFIDDGATSILLPGAMNPTGFATPANNRHAGIAMVGARTYTAGQTPRPRISADTVTSNVWYMLSVEWELRPGNWMPPT